MLAHLTLVVAHDRRSIDGPLAVLLTGLLIAAGLMASGILFIVPLGGSPGGFVRWSRFRISRIPSGLKTWI